MIETINQVSEVQSTNYKVGKTPQVLDKIHSSEINISIYERDTNDLQEEINQLIDAPMEIRASGNINDIMSQLMSDVDPSLYPNILQDIEQAISYFKSVTKTERFRLLLATVNTNMCRRFHTDINDLRMLCTYSGPGTLWLTDDNINHAALNNKGDNEAIVIDKNRIQQAATGAIVILKGAIYPQEPNKAVVHRSPTIEETGEKRLLLRIDTNETLNLWT